MVALADVRRARERISDQIRVTPCPPTEQFRDIFPGVLHLKRENEQFTGSFKVRGALNRILQLSEDERARGVVAASAGNHGQAVALHAGRMGAPATVVMPRTTPLVKIANTERLGARVELVGESFHEARERADELARTEGLTFIHAFDDEHVIAGQGTVGLEILEAVPQVDLVLVPVGGGGLVSGVAVALKASDPSIRVIGVEAAAAAGARASLDAGHPVELSSVDTIADGIAVKRVGEKTLPLIRKWVEKVVTVSEDAIAQAVLLLLEREKTVVEGAGAVALAALLEGRVSCGPGDVGVALLSGGNTDVNMISRIIHRGLVRDGRLVGLVATVRDRPGALARLTALVAETGANVLETYHQRAFADISVGDVEIVLHLETRGAGHAQEILDHLRENGIRTRRAD